MLKKLANKRLLPTATLYYRHKFLASLGQATILVYTMGKVGSSTVYYTLQKNKVSQLVYHVHFLSDAYLERMSAKYDQSGSGKDVPDKLSVNQLLKGSTDHMTASYTLKSVLESGAVNRWKIITLVRDPVATFFSHIFQNPKTHRPYLLGEDGKLDKNKVESYISDYFVHFDPDNDFISGWFDREFYDFTGTDVYQHPFDPLTGYNIIREGKFDIAIIALEELDNSLNHVIGELAGSTNNPNNFNVIKKNIRENQDETGLYTNLKNSIIIPKVGLKHVYSTKYATHFFSSEFRDKMIEKWALPRRHS